MLHDLLGAELCINGQGAEVSAILGVGYEVSFFDVRQGRIYMDSDEVRKYLVEVILFEVCRTKTQSYNTPAVCTRNGLQ